MPTKIVERTQRFRKDRPIPSRGWLEHEIVGFDHRYWQIRYKVEEKLLDEQPTGGIDCTGTRERDPQII